MTETEREGTSLDSLPNPLADYIAEPGDDEIIEAICQGSTRKEVCQKQGISMAYLKARIAFFQDVYQFPKDTATWKAVPDKLVENRDAVRAAIQRAREALAEDFSIHLFDF